MSQKVRHAEFREKTRQLLEGTLKHGRRGGQITASLTRRAFLTVPPASAVGAGLGLLATTGVVTDALAQSGVSTISSNFNGSAIQGGDWIWFTSVLKVHGLGNAPVTIGFTGSIQFSVDGTLYFLPVPSALVTFSPSVTVATTVFCNGQWVTTVPLSGLAGNVFLDGFALQAPFPSGFPGGIQPVTWQGMFFSLTPGITVQWQWAAAVYANPLFGLDYNQLGVKPVDDNKASIYQNSDHAGTPENFKSNVVGGARGGGGSNFTGSYSGTAPYTPLPASVVSACGGSR
jgi:hypothetical protein